MTYENFLSLVLQLKKQDRVISKLYDQKVDLLDFVEPYQVIITDLIKEIYGEDGYDWFSWFCYENDYGEKGMGAWDENKELICQDISSLWKYLESLKSTTV
jgi:hypothetical protein